MCSTNYVYTTDTHSNNSETTDITWPIARCNWSYLSENTTQMLHVACLQLTRLIDARCDMLGATITVLILRRSWDHSVSNIANDKPIHGLTGLRPKRCTLRSPVSPRPKSSVRLHDDKKLRPMASFPPTTVLLVYSIDSVWPLYEKSVVVMV